MMRYEYLLVIIPKILLFFLGNILGFLYLCRAIRNTTTLIHLLCNNQALWGEWNSPNSTFPTSNLVQHGRNSSLY